MGILILASQLVLVAFEQNTIRKNSGRRLTLTTSGKEEKRAECLSKALEGRTLLFTWN